MKIIAIALACSGLLACVGGCVSVPKDATPAFMLVGYAAKQTCSCLFVSARSLRSCEAEYDQQPAFRSFVWNVTPQSVTVSTNDGGVSQTAQYQDGFGCHLAD